MKVLRMHRNRTEHLWILTESLEDNSFTTGTEKNHHIWYNKCRTVGHLVKQSYQCVIISIPILNIIGIHVV